MALSLLPTLPLRWPAALWSSVLGARCARSLILSVRGADLPIRRQKRGCQPRGQHPRKSLSPSNFRWWRADSRPHYSAAPSSSNPAIYPSRLFLAGASNFNPSRPSFCLQLDPLSTSASALANAPGVVGSPALIPATNAAPAQARCRLVVYVRSPRSSAARAHSTIFSVIARPITAPSGALILFPLLRPGLIPRPPLCPQRGCCDSISTSSCDSVSSSLLRPNLTSLPATRSHCDQLSLRPSLIRPYRDLVSSSLFVRRPKGYPCHVGGSCITHTPIPTARNLRFPTFGDWERLGYGETGR